MGRKMRNIKSVAVWGEADLPNGYASVAMVILEPFTENYFTVGVPLAWLEKAPGIDLARVVGETISRELVSAVKK
jgi:hypothetical protein